MSANQTTIDERLRAALAYYDAHPWQPTTTLRWRQVPHTTTRPAVLEQLWQHGKTQEVEWRPVPTETAP